ncbi:Mov34/MPN/PAD-1 family protein [Thermogemmatispora carboxidivorans]|uniref:Mov34/MPN/PAD-1 family protein n=1 Tax=Thermogemmatispora carboxidivorans TaxID=1382306 RepID=UPI0009DF7583|nr:Mov34/MPN/PAD-1 family protein [Thermogemmatispora carboxidivorans]
MPQEARGKGQPGARKREGGSVVLPRAVQRALLRDVWGRREIEACGLLRGEIDAEGNWHVVAVHPLPNIAESPVFFEFAPEDVLQLELAYPGQIIGVYHSHPGGLHGASRTDRATMRRVNEEQQIPWVWLIVCGPFTADLPVVEASAGERAAEETCARWLAEQLLAYYHDPSEGLQQVVAVLEPGPQSAEAGQSVRAE